MKEIFINEDDFLTVNYERTDEGRLVSIKHMRYNHNEWTNKLVSELLLDPIDAADLCSEVSRVVTEVLRRNV